MKIKLIALDMDGTLLNSQKEISDRNKEVLATCLSRGIYIVPSTGRTADGIPQVVKQIAGVRYAVTTNGAVVLDMVGGITIDTRKLAYEKALELLNVVEQFDAMYDPYIDGRGISQPEFYEHLSEYGLSVQMKELVHKTRDVVPNIKEYVKANKKPVEKINLFFKDMDERDRAKAILEKRTDIILTSSISNNLEINDTEATKGKGLKRLAEYLNLSMDEILAIGDGDNDISMIKAAGIGVAMENAPIEVKKVADDITLTNDQDGVAAAIEKFVLN